jgi:uncharacterized protein
MILHGGERVSLESGVPGLHTMGVSLGRIVRFCGHTEKWYSVLCHTLVVAALMEPEHGIYGLFHDTPEVMVSDVPTPMKSQVARRRESVLLKRIYAANGLEWPMPDDILSELEEADHTALIAEAHILGHPGKEKIWGTEYDAEAGRLTRKYLKKAPEFMIPEVAGKAFEKAYKKYAALAGLDNASWD